MRVRLGAYGIHLLPGEPRARASRVRLTLTTIRTARLSGYARLNRHDQSGPPSLDARSAPTSPKFSLVAACAILPETGDVRGGAKQKELHLTMGGKPRQNSPIAECLGDDGLCQPIRLRRFAARACRRHESPNLIYVPAPRLAESSSRSADVA